jgi:hypothetical protein
VRIDAEEKRRKEEGYQKAYELGLRLKSNEALAKAIQGIKSGDLDLKERTAIVNTAKDLMDKDPKLDEEQAMMRAEEMYAKKKEGPKMKLKGGTDAFERAGILSNISGY